MAEDQNMSTEVEQPMASATSTPADKKSKCPVTNIWVRLAVALVLGLVIGFLAKSFINLPFGGSGLKLTADGTIAKDGLNQVIGTVSYKGKNYDISVNEAISASGSPASQYVDKSGNYRLVSADSVLAAARAKVLLAVAESEGISASDQDLADFAKKQLQSTDYDALASRYQMSKDEFMSLLKQTVITQKLYDAKTKDVDTSKIPEQPTPPSTQDEATKPSKTYADYVLKLVGSAWDAQNNKWADENSSYAKALGKVDFNAGLTYQQAATAFNIAYNEFAQSGGTTPDSVWSSFVAKTMSEASINVKALGY